MSVLTKRVFVVWHRPRNKKKWVKKGEYPNVLDAAGVVLGDEAMTRGGAWKALPEGQDPDAPDDDE